MIHTRLDITLILEGPVLSGSSAPGTYGVDKPALRDQSGQVILPATLVKGRLRESLAELVSAAGPGFRPDLSWLLGHRAPTEGEVETSVEPARGRLEFTDFVCRAAERTGFRHRIRLDSRRRAAAKGALLVAESPFRSGEAVPFEGRIEYWSLSADAAATVAAQIERGLLWTISFGWGRTVGLGRLLSLAMRRTDSHTIESSATTVEAGSLDLVIQPAAPICLAGHRTVANLFESAEVIPGGALKGALAETWAAMLGARPGTTVGELASLDSPRRQLAAHFDALVFSHAAPCQADRRLRPVRTPLSVVKVADGDAWFDVATLGRPVLIHAKAPEFRVDWKVEHDVDAAFGWPRLRRELTLHTAIDAHRRRAKDEALYAYETVIPDGCVWLARVSLEGIGDPAVRRFVGSQLADLLAGGLRCLGKTQARAEVKVQEGGTWRAAHASDSRPRDGQWIITLQTPALLCDPRLLTGADRNERLCESYANYWHEVSEGRLILQHFYARQCLAGGFYLWKRFQPDRPYNPWLLTESGSVFVLRATPAANPDDTVRLVENWLRRGLPFPGWARARYDRQGRAGDDWRNCPYIPQNGYGEIAVNLDMHWRHSPPPEHTEAVHLLRTSTEEPSAQSAAAPSNVAVSSTQLQRPDEVADKPRTASPLPPDPAYPPFRSRWLIEGQLETRTPFHLGDGEYVEWPEGRTSKQALPPLRKTVFRDARGLPCIPGSSLKAVLRAALASSAAAAADLAFMFGKGETETVGGEGGALEFSDARVPAGASAPDYTHLPPYWEPARLTATEAGVALNRRTRAADENKLFHQEVVPQGVAFAIRISGQNIEEHQVALLLRALEGFNPEEPADPLTLGADTGSGKGRFRWVNPKVSRLASQDVDAWLQQPRPLHEAAYALPDSERLRLQALCPLTVSAGSGPTLEFNLRLRFDGPFLVNDPSRCAKSDEDQNPDSKGEPRQPDHYPLLTVHRHALLPASAFRGALRTQAERILRTLASGADDPASDAELRQPPVALEARLAPEHFAGVSLGGGVLGVTGWASPFILTDFTGLEPVQLPLRRQEFVAIDRFTGGSAGSMKFSADVVDNAVLEGTLRVRLAAWDAAGITGPAKGLLALILRDLIEGDVTLGFGAAKGFGVCRAEFQDDRSRETYESLAASLSALRCHAALSPAPAEP